MVASGYHAIAARHSGFMTAVGREWLNECAVRPICSPRRPLAIASTGRNRLFRAPSPPLQLRHTRGLSTHGPSRPIAFFYPNRGRMPPRRPTPSCHFAFSHPLLSAQHLYWRGRRFAADNRQCAYICSLDFCKLRELLAGQSGSPVQCCRIQGRHAVTWTPKSL